MCGQPCIFIIRDDVKIWQKYPIFSMIALLTRSSPLSTGMEITIFFCDEFPIFSQQYILTPSPVYLYIAKIENFCHILMSSLRPYNIYCVVWVRILFKRKGTSERGKKTFAQEINDRIHKFSVRDCNRSEVTQTIQFILNGVSQWDFRLYVS